MIASQRDRRKNQKLNKPHDQKTSSHLTVVKAVMTLPWPPYFALIRTAIFIIAPFSDKYSNPNKKMTLPIILTLSEIIRLIEKTLSYQLNFPPGDGVGFLQ